MSLRINNNLEAQETLRQLTKAQNSFSQAMQRLSSGKRINSAADDAAGYAISQKLLSQNKGLDQASSNAQDGISMLQTAAGGLQTTHDLLQRLRQLAVQSANDTNTQSDRAALQNEANQITQEISQIASTTQFNTKNLLDGSSGVAVSVTSGSETVKAVNPGTIAGQSNTGTFSLSMSSSTAGTLTYTDLTGAAKTVNVSVSTSNGVTTIADSATTNNTGFSLTVTGAVTNGDTMTLTDHSSTLQVGANSGQSIVVSIGDMRAKALGVQNASETDNLGTQALDISSSSTAASNAISAIDSAIQTVSNQAANLGAVQNRLSAAMNNLAIQSENMQASYSAITNVNMAQESTELATAQILNQSSTAMLAQANQAPQGVLKLLGG